jgi:hypothetical protein
MGHDIPHIGPLLIEVEHCGDPVLVAADIEDHVAVHIVRGPEGLPQRREGQGAAFAEPSIPVL